MNTNTPISPEVPVKRKGRGRPRVPEEKKLKTVSYRIPPVLIEYIEGQARDWGVSKGRKLTEIIEYHRDAL